MDTQQLSPAQIITFNDYPVHNEQILKIYFKIYQQGAGRIIPAVPVMSLEKVKLHIKNALYAEFLCQHPDTEYFLLDGSHKTTAATLAHQPIKVMLFRNDQDIQEAVKMVEEGHLFSLTTGNTIDECIQVLRKHFKSPAKFQTVLEKTHKMVQEKVIPTYMIDYYFNQQSPASMV
jgi:hypothetical protein